MADNLTTHIEKTAAPFLPPAASRAVLDALGSAVMVVDRSGMIRYRNTVAHGMLLPGHDLSTVLATFNVFGEFPGWENLPKVVAASKRVISWEAVRTSVSPSIEPAKVVVRCVPFGEAMSHTCEIVVQIDECRPGDLSSDTTDLSRRLAALGKVAAQVAHELNNPLDGVLRYLNLALRLASDLPESKLQTYLAESRTGVMRMVQVVGELLEFSRATDGDFDESDINEIVEQAIRQTTADNEADGIVVTADFQSQTMPTVRGSRLYQVCCNLIKNAIDAMSDGGRLTVTTGLVEGQVVIRIADTGEGLPEDREKIFQAFYTTKPTGTGLGLAICRDFIEDMGGTITAATGRDGGAVFTVRIPTSACGRARPPRAEHPEFT